jgi:hypothetical protein
MSAREPPEKLTPKQLAHELQVDIRTLWDWRGSRIGPLYRREVNRIFYYREDIEAWKESTKWA